ncbi:MAG: ATP-binding protein [Myxococcota bacterium]
MRVRVFGTFTVEIEGRALPPEAWRRRRAADLLAALAASGGDLSREAVVELLWPDKDRDAGANNLHRAVHDLRQVVGEVVRLEKGRVRLDPDVHVDVAEFEGALAAGDPARAIALYAGDLDVVDALEPRRDELRRRFVDACLAHARARSSAGDDPAAVATLRRLLAVEPLCEDGHVALVRSLARLGHADEARRAAEAAAVALGRPCPRAIAELRPAQAATGPETAARIARRLLGSASPPPIRGRDAAVADVAAFVAGGSGTLVLLGEAGVGKTRLAVEAARLAEAAGAVLLAGAAHEVTAASPYVPFLDAWTHHLRAAGRPPGDNPFATFRPNPAGAIQDDKHRLFQSVERELLAVGGGRPVCLVLDDLHLADESSLHLVRWLARAARSQPLLLVATCRDEEVRRATPLHALLADLHRDRSARRVALDRLDRDATAALLADLFGEPPGADLVRDVYRRAEGNPFYVEEVARAGPHLPAELADTVRARVARAGEDVERLLVAASVLGPRFALPVAAAVAEMADPVATLDRAVEARLVEEADGDVRFRHALVREALVGTLTRARRVQLHRRAAAALAGGDAAEVAFHHLAGDEPAAALPHLVAAGRRAAATTGLREAVGFFEQADAILRTVGGDRYPLLLGMGQMRIALSELDLAMTHLDDAAAVATTPEMRANALRLGSLAAVTGGELVRADTFLARARAAIADDSPALPNVLYQTAQLRWHESRYADAYALSEQCLAVAERHGDKDALAKGYEMLALACHSLGAWKEGVASERRRQEVVGHAVDVASIFDVHL